jgi:hypothetical protein
MSARCLPGGSEQNTDEVRMGRVLRFTRPHNATTTQARYPRVSEVTAHISHVADELLGAPQSLEEGARLYRQLEGRLAKEERDLLAKFYEATIAHEEKFEHAAYLVGLLAGSGQLAENVVFLDERLSGEATRATAEDDIRGDTRR